MTFRNRSRELFVALHMASIVFVAKGSALAQSRLILGGVRT